jgi:hypothetical protein
LPGQVAYIILKIPIANEIPAARSISSALTREIGSFIRRDRCATFYRAVLHAVSFHVIAIDLAGRAGRIALPISVQFVIGAGITGSRIIRVALKWAVESAVEGRAARTKIGWTPEVGTHLYRFGRGTRGGRSRGQGREGGQRDSYRLRSYLTAVAIGAIGVGDLTAARIIRDRIKVAVARKLTPAIVNALRSRDRLQPERGDRRDRHGHT